jgi:hypothetical protein
MQLWVRFPNDGSVVALVDAAEDCPFVRDPQTGSFVLGTFTPGVAYPRLRPQLDAFLAVYGTGNLARAAAMHEELDRLALVASDAGGRSYELWNIVFQDGGLLFNARPKPPT